MKLLVVMVYNEYIEQVLVFLHVEQVKQLILLMKRVLQELDAFFRFAKRNESMSMKYFCHKMYLLLSILLPMVFVSLDHLHELLLVINRQNLNRQSKKRYDRIKR